MLGRNKKRGPFLVLSGSTELFLCPPILLQPPLPDPDLGSTADSGAAAGHVHRGLLPVPRHAAASPTHLEFLQAATLHSQLHPHQPVHVFHAAGGSHPHPRPFATSTGPLPRGPGSCPVEPGPRCLPHSPDRDPVLRGCQLHVAAGGGCLPTQSLGACGRFRGGPLPLLPASRLGYLYENTQCWERNDVKAIWWIIRTPILMTILINFLIFIRILGILVSKLRTRQMRCPDYRLRASWSVSCTASSTRRCSRRSAAAGTAVACATASGRSAASHRSAPRGSCPPAQAPAGAPLTAPCPWGPSQGLGMRPAGSWKVTARQRRAVSIRVRMHLLRAYCVPGPAWRALEKLGCGGRGKQDKVPVLLEFTGHNGAGVGS
ncbi:gastric inhibitory polypeptide receptor isoform X3 [Lutra lutra]|uniref:gastric inhibitory polypeptide receptor isoform X3 n=1 Tax=Lutra lutra TaxID=9657 RepID=UPI001FD2A178|nr:gastric inhibitory polypeptide receptor isoform X3 [Lutra lutra]